MLKTILSFFSSKSDGLAISKSSQPYAPNPEEWYASDWQDEYGKPVYRPSEYAGYMYKSFEIDCYVLDLNTKAGVVRDCRTHIIVSDMQLQYDTKAIYNETRQGGYGVKLIEYNMNRYLRFLHIKNNDFTDLLNEAAAFQVKVKITGIVEFVDFADKELQKVGNFDGWNTSNACPVVKIYSVEALHDD